MDTNILYCNENGIEYWTVEETGESAVSQRGLARMCGVQVREIQRYLGLDYKSAGSKLETIDGLDIYLTTKVVKKGKAIAPIASQVAALIIEHCAIDRAKPEARLTLRAFLHIGMDSFIQGKTGWLPKEKQSAARSRSLIDCILSDPKTWTMHFRPQWQREACRVTGYRWHSCRPMAQFISTYIYKALPADVYEKLMEQNAERRFKHHQFFDDLSDNLILKEHIQQVEGLLRCSQDKAHFKRLFASAFGDGIQGDLMLEEAEG